LKKEIKSSTTLNQWITEGIKISCKKRRNFFELCRHSNDLNIKIYYKRYCAVLSTVILTAKKLHYNKIILGSKNKMKSTCKIINEKGKTKSCIDIHSLVINNHVIMNQNKIPNILNNYFISVGDTISSDNKKHKYKYN
jgi:hypothetical protein